MKCSKCDRINDGSCKFYKQWVETYTSSGGKSRTEKIVCENCSNAEERTKQCDNCGLTTSNLSTSWCSKNCQWGKEKQFCQNCVIDHNQQVENHRKTCPIKNRHRNQTASRN